MSSMIQWKWKKSNMYVCNVEESEPSTSIIIYKHYLRDIKNLVRKLLGEVPFAQEVMELLLNKEKGEDIIAFCCKQKVFVEAFNYKRDIFYKPGANGQMIFSKEEYILFFTEFIPLLWVVHHRQIYMYNPKGGLLEIYSIQQGDSLLSRFMKLTMPKELHQIASIWFHRGDELYEIDGPVYSHYISLEETTDELMIYKTFIDYYFTKTIKPCKTVRRSTIVDACEKHSQKITIKGEAEKLPCLLQRSIEFTKLWSDYMVNNHSIEVGNKIVLVTDLKQKSN